ncbi:hypothetical protein SAMN05216474_2137 [Lishizhenia tianjinensis]|uniref:Uncharacterized protein n=1 Tax=Lishizhenia tianjinensis TaxID=477690 RepID=A0A1I7AJ00_9FLAO|nr:hypothetical protein [Lishizhenia tianjinensis]SFT74883.1 hypothetical protein SAMN05216474_2137 [Lishizhenia tianjinensis]
MKLTTWEKFVCSLISVNKWDISNTLKNLDEMKSQELFDVQKLENLDVIEIGNKLKRGGYDRGSLTYMIAERLQEASSKINQEGLTRCEKILSNDTNESREFLRGFKGFGPKTIEVFYNLK